MSTPFFNVEVTGWYSDNSVEIAATSILGRIKMAVVQAARDHKLITTINSHNRRACIAVTTQYHDPEAFDWIRGRGFTLRREDLRISDDRVVVVFGTTQRVKNIHFTLLEIPNIKDHIVTVNRILDIVWRDFFPPQQT